MKNHADHIDSGSGRTGAAPAGCLAIGAGTSLVSGCEEKPERFVANPIQDRTESLIKANETPTAPNCILADHNEGPNTSG